MLHATKCCNHIHKENLLSKCIFWVQSWWHFTTGNLAACPEIHPDFFCFVWKAFKYFIHVYCMMNNRRFIVWNPHQNFQQIYIC